MIRLFSSSEADRCMTWLNTKAKKTHTCKSRMQNDHVTYFNSEKSFTWLMFHSKDFSTRASTQQIFFDNFFLFDMFMLEWRIDFRSSNFLLYLSVDIE